MTVFSLEQGLGGTALIIPPKELRVRVGPFDDADVFLASGHQTVELAKRMTRVSSSSDILDIGCGCGRFALAVADILEDGTYVGLDPDREHINWCNETIASRNGRFRFYHLDIDAPPYNERGRVRPEEVELPVSGAFDIVILSSVLTHMMPTAITHYLLKLSGLLESDGQCLLSALLLNDEAKQAIREGRTDFKFVHALGSCCWALDRENPLEGVAMEEEWFLERLGANGLVLDRVRYGTWRDVKGVAIEHDWMTVSRAR